VAGKWPRPLASSCSRSAGELPIAQYGAFMCLLPPRELELQHTVRYTVRVREPERCRALSASFVRKTLGESERSGGECRLRTISDIVVFSVSAHTSPPGVGVADTTRRARAVLCGCCVTVVLVAAATPRAYAECCHAERSGRTRGRPMHTAPAGMHHPPRHPTRASGDRFGRVRTGRTGRRAGPPGNTGCERDVYGL
jgi:hypothetical protein